MVAQSVTGAAAGARVPRDVAAIPSDEEVLREIDDPATGQHWLLVRDLIHPAGPGRLVLAPRPICGEKKDCIPKQRIPGGVLPVIHMGDTVTVEEHTPVLDMRLQAVALEPSLQGALFKVRLKIGGKVVRVRAVAPGHALIPPENEGKP
ncbi:MAG: hypothetical protein ACRD3S_20700 [Terracidiphilus sp.]